MERTLIGNLTENKNVLIKGFVENIRNKKSMQFVVIRDITGKVQLTIEKEKTPEIAKIFETILCESVVEVEGECVLNDFVKMGGKEILPTAVRVQSTAEALPLNEQSNLDQRLDYRFLDLRSEKNLAIFQVGTVLEHAMREFMISQNAIEIHTPKISGLSSEGGAEVFSFDYYGKKACLTQSPQLYKQMSIMAGFEKTFEFGACYRAEKSYTWRHATEFFAFDLEMGYINNHHDVMDLEENLLRYTLNQVKQKCQKQLQLLNVEVNVDNKFPRIPLSEVHEIVLREYGYKCPKGDLDTESERLIGKYVKEKFNSDFVFVTEYPFANRAFYSMKCEDNPLLTKSFDLIYKSAEITSGAQREHRVNELKQNITEKGMNAESMKDYLEFFRYGAPTHGGFAIGLARILAILLNVASIKETTFVFRGPDRITP